MSDTVSDILEPVFLHVAAKRCHCATEPASERSLMLQGRPFTPLTQVSPFLRAASA